MIKKISKYQLIIKFLLGAIVGGVFLWLVISKINGYEFKRLFQQMRWNNLILAMLFFYTGLYVRSIRWYLLLKKIAPLAICQVLVALITGYAVNYVLPARLGELFRVEFCKRQYGVSRTYALSTIVLERLSDSCIMAFALCSGLLGMQLQGQLNSEVLWSLSVSAIAILAAMCVAFLIIFRLKINLPKILHFSSIANRLSLFMESIALLKKDIIVRVFGIGLLIWCIEIAATGNIFWALGIKLTLLQMLLVVGALSLSTLLPSPPGFLGTMQYACVITITPLGYSDTQAIAATLAMQVFFFGSLAFIGSLLLLKINISKLLIRR